MKEDVERKLRAICGRLEGARRIRKQWDVRLYNTYGYGHELALALAGIGLSHPLVHVFAGGAADLSGDPATADLLGSFKHYPWWLLTIVVLSVTFWVITRVIVNRRHLETKVPLYDACRRELGKVESDLDSALQDTEPLNELGEIFLRAKEVVDRYYAAGGWPWHAEPPNAQSAVTQRVNRFVEQYGNLWTPVPRHVQQREPAMPGGRG